MEYEDEYRIWISQINQINITVNAYSKEEAKEKVIKEWKRRFGNPLIIYIEKNGEQV